MRCRADQRLRSRAAGRPARRKYAPDIAGGFHISKAQTRFPMSPKWTKINPRATLPAPAVKPTLQNGTVAIGEDLCGRAHS